MDKTRYRIKITQVEERQCQTREYEKLSDKGNKEDGGARYGYVYAHSTEEVETNILSQTVEELDLPAVIKAINNL